MQGVMISELRQNEHLVRLVTPEVRWVIEVIISEPGVRAIAVLEGGLEVSGDLGLCLPGTCSGRCFTLHVRTQVIGDVRNMSHDLAKRANVLGGPVAVL